VLQKRFLEPVGAESNTVGEGYLSRDIIYWAGLGENSIASAATAAASTTSAAATAVAAASTTSAAATTVFAWFGFIDRQRATVVFLAVEPLNGRLGLLIAAHLYESESLATAAFAILDYLGTANCAKGGK
jgi:hypothetical protein